MKEADFIAAIAKSKTKARRIAKSLSTDQIDSAIANLKAASQAEARAAKTKATKKRKANIAKAAKLMREWGVSASHRLRSAPEKCGRKAAANKSKVKRGTPKGTKVAPKYSLKACGSIYQRTERFRMPVVFGEYVEKGGSLEKLLIK